MPENISIVNYVQDLYKYINDPDLAFDSPYYPIGENLFSQEYALAFANDRYSHYIEDGTIDFIKGDKLVEQFIPGAAYLSINTGEVRNLTQLSTILSDTLNITLWEKGLENFLSLQTQKLSNTSGQRLNFNGAYGTYYWEMFFHIPFLIANHLNANQDFKGAKWWYERIFNPTSSEKPDMTKPAEHYWQFREFRNLDITRLKDILSNEATIAIYKNDPFDPHAIARLRISAYQKSVVMKYIGNLLDWGDYLFTQDTQESIVEADMLYQLAQDILGKRPERTGKCKTEDDDKINFEKISASNNDGSEFLINLENVYGSVQRINMNDRDVLERTKFVSQLLEELGDTNATPNTFSDWANFSNATYYADLKLEDPTIPTPGPLPVFDVPSPRVAKYSEVKKLNYKPSVEKSKIYGDIIKLGNITVYGYGPTKLPATDLITKSKLAFCVPVNENQLEYWNRVEDRLFKIRNCMNISGIRRSLALYQPPIDPMLLVRAKAAGLSLEEILAGGTGITNLPNYRFVYMLEKAKQFAQNLQGLGSELLTALEKKVGEELTLLRSVHERNILRLTSDIKSKQVEDAQKQYNSSEENITNIENRIGYYRGLIEKGLTASEKTQQVTRHAATALKISEGVLHLHAGLAYLLPQLGSPFALTYGGHQLGANFNAFAEWSSSIGSVLDSISSSAGLEAGFTRRKEEWNFQLLTAKQEFRQATEQLLSADLKIKIAQRDLDIHEKTIEHSDEVHEFLQDKFTSLGLYNYMATSLNRLHRLSFSMALDMAKLAEKCYRFETYDDSTFIENDNWQNDRVGLLSGERLMLQLNRMERNYMDKYKRCPEITQHFSLLTLDPGALLNLKQTGKCDINIPEIAFDILYPGQYRRLIRGVRISIPSIAGPYTNVSAKLRLKESNLRVNETDEALTVNDIAKNSSITTSSAINDSGTFEFNFRDERYLPFEYAGAISKWELSLPTKIRLFNYNSISDVIMHVSYISTEGDREAGEQKVLDAFEAYSETNGLFTIISLKYEFPDGFHKFLNSVAQNIEFDLTSDYFPYFLVDKTLSITDTKVYLKPRKGMAVTIPTVMKINQVNNVTWHSEDDIPSNDAASGNDIIKAGSVTLTGSPFIKWKIDAGNNGIDKEKTEDILILIKYKTDTV